MQYNSDMQNIYQAKGTTIVEQYRDVGRLFAPTIQQAVMKLKKKRARTTVTRRRVAEKTWSNLLENKVCREFVQCLTAWSEGAGISTKQAMWLLADNFTGCQTLMFRYASGVALLHTEEEFIDDKHVEYHLTSPHTVEFKEGEVVSKSLVYNNLLPGAGLYSWKRDMVIAVDALYIREDAIEEIGNPMMVNVISWLIWRMSPEEADSEKVVQLVSVLGELVDGYAINIVRKVGERIEGYKLTFARSEHYVEYLGRDLGSYLRQANIVDTRYPKMKWALPPKQIWRGGWKYFTQRCMTMDDHAKRYAYLRGFKLQSHNLLGAHKLVQETIFTQLRESYVTRDVRAVCAGLVDCAGTSVSCKLNDDKPINHWEYIDVQN